MQVGIATLSFPQVNPLDKAHHVLVARFKLSQRRLRELAERLDLLQEELIGHHLVITTELKGRELVVCYVPDQRVPRVQMRTVFHNACMRVGLPQRRPHRKRGRR